MTWNFVKLDAIGIYGIDMHIENEELDRPVMQRLLERKDIIRMYLGNVDFTSYFLSMTDDVPSLDTITEEMFKKWKKEVYRAYKAIYANEKYWMDKRNEGLEV